MKLSEAQKVYIVTRLALYEAPAAIAESFRDDFGEKIEAKRVHEWDASKPANRKRIAADLRDLFDRTRAEFDAEKVAVPISNKIFQLRLLQRIAERAMRDGNDVLVMDAIEKAAKITGGAYTNHRTLGGKPGDGTPIPVAAAIVEVPALANNMELWIRNHTPQGAEAIAAEERAAGGASQ